MGRKESNQTNRPYITERLLMGCKESNQTAKLLAAMTILYGLVYISSLLNNGNILNKNIKSLENICVM